MKEQRKKRMTKRLLVLSSALALAGVLLAAVIVEQTPGVPSVFNPTESAFQQQTHFLVFPESKVSENAKSATAYYNAIDPSSSNRDFKQWLKNAGFISDVSQWHASGKQIISCKLGCDIPGGAYGDNIINTDSHAIVVNAADLGFVRSQFIRCVPSCSAANPIIYTYLENYPVNPFAASGNGGSGFPFKSGYPSQAEATLAIASAVNRPLGALPGCDPTKTDTPFGCKISRIADVAFVWGPPPTNPTSSSRYGQIYAFIFNESDPSNITETIASPTAGAAPNPATGLLEPFNAGDPFAPNLDFIGNKQNPGVCLICHGGNPANLTASGAYPSQGNISGFRFLPLDVRNLIYSSDTGSESTSRASQEAQMKEYNKAVLLTIPKGASSDGSTTRVAHIREVITGWYAGSPGDTTLSGATQNSDFLPVGWREPVHGGTAPPGSEVLYSEVVSPACRSCHFNRELSLDFGTAADFLSHKSDITELVLGPLCTASNPPKGFRPMPLAHLTLQRFWQANGTAELLPSGQPPLTLFNTAELLAVYLGYGGTANFCRTF